MKLPWMQQNLMNARYLDVSYKRCKVQQTGHRSNLVVDSVRMIEDLNTHRKPAIIGARTMSKTVFETPDESFI